MHACSRMCVCPGASIRTPLASWRLGVKPLRFLSETSAVPASLRDNLSWSVSDPSRAEPSKPRERKYSRRDAATQRRLFRQTIHGAHYTVFHQRGPEVQEIAQTQVGESEVGLYLFPMYGRDGLDGLEFQNDQILDDEVGAKTFVEDQVAEANRHGNLTLNFQSRLDEKLCQYSFVNRLEQAGSEFAVYRECGFDDAGSNGVLVHAPEFRAPVPPCDNLSWFRLPFLLQSVSPRRCVAARELALVFSLLRIQTNPGNQTRKYSRRGAENAEDG